MLVKIWFVIKYKNYTSLLLITTFELVVGGLFVDDVSDGNWTDAELIIADGVNTATIGADEVGANDVDAVGVDAGFFELDDWWLLSFISIFSDTFSWCGESTIIFASIIGSYIKIKKKTILNSLETS